MPFFDDRVVDYTITPYNQTEWAPPRLHIHPHCEMMIVLNNSKAKCSINGSVYHIDRPFIAFFAPFCLHQVNFLGKKDEGRFVYYFYNRFTESYPEVFNAFDTYMNSTAVVFVLTDELVEELLPLHIKAFETRDDSLLSKLHFMVATHILLSKKDECELINANDQMNHMVPIIRYITEHFHEDITCESVAKQFFMSKAKLNRNFREYTTVSFHQFLSELRINKSQFMLKQGYSINEIAASVGFDNVSYFCQFFKKIKGVTPLQYAKKYNWKKSHPKQ